MFRTTLTLLALAALLAAASPPESSPSTVVAGATIPTDSTLKIEATHQEHQLTSPTAITFDDQGRIFISETHRLRKGAEDNRDHLYWYLDDLASKKTTDRRTLLEKWNSKVPTASLTRHSEVIRRLADTDGDGKIDESKVFADGYNDLLDGPASGIFYHEGSLYFACIPKIQMLRDTDDDGTADERKTVEEGFGVRVSLSGHDLHGFTLGPDGRIYGTAGDRGLSFITKQGVSVDYPNEGVVFRFEPDGSGFEIFHTGLRNPKEIAFDALGNAFSVDSNSGAGDKSRIVYLVEGGDSGWQMEHQALHTFHHQIGLENRPPSRWMDEKMWELENPAQPAFMLPPAAHLTDGPSGLTSNPGAGFLASEAGRFLICDYSGTPADSGIWSFAMKPKGAGMEMSDARQFVWGVAATDVEYSWDGKIFISDFISGGESHDAGRLLSLDAGDKTWQAAEAAGTAKIIKEGFEQRSSAVLANLLKHPDARIRLRAQIALTRKPDARVRFIEAADSSNFMVRIHGIQGLGILCRRGSVPLPYATFGDIPTAKNRKQAEEKLIALLQDKNPEIRTQSLRALAGSKNDGSSIPLTILLADESPRVRFFAAILIGKLKMIALYGPICEMLAENNNRDAYLRHAGIYALQHMAPNPRVLSALSGHESPAVRLAATVALRRLKSANVATFIQDADPQVADEAIRAVCDLDMVSRRPVVAEQLDDLTRRPWSPLMLRRLIHNAFRVGTPENATRLVKFALDPSLPEIPRIEALRLLSQWTEPFPVDQFTGIWRPLEKRSLAPLTSKALDAAFVKKLDALRTANAISPIPTDLLTAARTRKVPAVKKAIAELEKSRPSRALESEITAAPIPAIDPAFLKTGKQQFIICSACHGQSGEGTAAAPPLAGSEWVNGPEENLIRIQLRGLRGPIPVKGLEYNIPGGMAALAYQSDEQIAAVLTYVRSSFGNSAPAVSPAAIAALRGEVGKPQLFASDLTSPSPQPSVPAAGRGKYDAITTEDSYPAYLKWIALGIGLLAVIGVLRLKKK